jgi:uncharacterized glyoxalase superfamily protein PhnB
MSFDAIGIVAEDCERSVRFYRLLGVEFIRAGDSEHFEAKTRSGVRLLLDSAALIKKFEPDYEKVRGSGISLCFKQESREKVDQLYAAITAAGFYGKKAPWDAFWGQRYACVLDPDGNQIDLFA